MMRLISALGAMLACALFVASNAFAANHYVSTAFLPVFDQSCSNPGFNSIQAAVVGSLPGDTIVVCDGVYSEDVDINKSVSLVGSGNSVIQAPASNPAGGDVVTVSAASAVTMSGFIVRGPGPGGCNSIGAGVRVRDGATLDLSFTEIRDIRDIGDNAPYTFSGCQNGEGIRVGARGGVGGPGHATIDNVIVTHYQKNGITVSGSGTTARITNSTVTGFGANTLIAQNGIQVSGQAAATISTSTIRDNDYLPKTFFACGLLFVDAQGVNDDNNVYLNNEKDKCGALGRGGTYEGAP
jgi:hypothetical protein